ncbi:MAG: HEPN domain-containing protein [Myxococcales bacterium]|nr:HEPN domain-containing protein [Myxococcales bacterium]
MSPENRRLAIDEELVAMDENLAAARALIGLNLLRPAMTRVYYAVFHAARALLFAEGIEPKSHEGVQHLFNLHYVKAGRIEPVWNRVYSRLQKFREEADYGSAFVLDREGLEEELAAAAELCQLARRLLATCP